jgi:hypothetical protein
MTSGRWVFVKTSEIIAFPSALGEDFGAAGCAGPLRKYFCKEGQNCLHFSR